MMDYKSAGVDIEAGYKAVELMKKHVKTTMRPDIVTVYSIGNVSKEICGGPHVKNTSELSEVRIVKEEASSQGVRRIKMQFK